MPTIDGLMLNLNILGQTMPFTEKNNTYMKDKKRFPADVLLNKLIYDHLRTMIKHYKPL